jgi:tetratricopeptide (TPR) repeat protein
MTSFSQKRQIELIIYLLLVVGILSCYWRVQYADFVNIDDTVYVSENRNVQAGLTREGIVWAFTTFEAANWHPLTWLSHMLDCQIFGLNPRGHHLTSLLFHISNSMLLFYVLCRMTGGVWKSALVAALFALHPLHVESVAWISERKDVLSTFFGLISIAAYIKYAQEKRPVSYLLCILFLGLGLMAKPMLVTFPFVLLLLDFWPLKRFSGEHYGVPRTEVAAVFSRRNLFSLIREKIPLFILVIFMSMTTITAQQSKGAVQTLEYFPFHLRVYNALITYVTYIAKTVWPSYLSIYYPHPGNTLLLWQVAGAASMLIMITVIAVGISGRYPFAVVGWFWYLGTLVPVVGLVQVGTQAMADRYTYIPLTGLFIIAVWGITDILEKRKHGRAVAAALTVIILSALGVRTAQQVGFWQNNLTLYTNAIRGNDRNDLAHNNLGVALEAVGKRDRAISHYRKSVEINPLNVDAFNNLANVLADKERFEEAEKYYRKALGIEPDNAVYHYNIGVLYIRQGKTEEALKQFAEAIQNKPDFAKVYNHTGVVLARQGKLEKARIFFLKAIQIDPGFAAARRNLKFYRAPFQRPEGSGASSRQDDLNGRQE